MNLKDKYALVTGATSGIGKATAIDFIQNGANVIITGRYIDTLTETAAELGPQCIPIVSDAGNMDDVLRLGTQIQEITSTIDVLFVNAGIVKYAPIEQVDETHFDEHFNVLVKGTLFTVQQLIPLMKEGGSIILNTSIVTEIGLPHSSVYSAAKAAVQSLMRSLAAELSSRKIRVNSISPGPINTNYFDRSNLTTEQYEGMVNWVLPQVPLARYGQPSEVAKAVTFLASDASSFIHGAEINVDGGFPRIKVLG